METKKLYRSRKDKIVAGVCGGLAEYFEIDSVIVRLVFVLLTIFGGTGILLYIIGIIIIPEEGEKKGTDTKEKIHEKVSMAASEVKKTVENNTKSYRGEQIFGFIVLFIGLAILFNKFVPWFHFSVLWPAILIILGLALIFNPNKKG